MSSSMSTGASATSTPPTSETPTTRELMSRLWRSTLPMTLGIMGLLGFNLVDAAFVSHLGTAPLAAQSFTFPLTFLIIGVQVGMGIAIAAIVSRTLGAEDEARARRLGGVVLLGSGVLMALLMLLLWVIRVPAFELLGANATEMTLIEVYWGPSLIASWLGAMAYVLYSLFRAHGDTRLPGEMMLLTSVFNLVLDPLLIFGAGPLPGFGLAGAAWATVLSFGAGLAITAFKLSRRDWMEYRGLWAEWQASRRQLAGIAIPAILCQMMPALSAMLVTAIVAGLGQTEVAAWGIASRLETFSLIVVLALTMSLPPWLGRCYGAGRWQEIRRLMNLAARVVVIWQLVLGIIAAVLATPLAYVLVGSDEVSAALAVLLPWMLPSYSFLGICMLVVSAANALGWPLRATALSFVRLFICFMPAVWLGAHLDGLRGVAIGSAIGNLLAGVVAWRVYRQALGDRGKSVRRHAYVATT